MLLIFLKKNCIKVVFILTVKFVSTTLTATPVVSGTLAPVPGLTRFHPPANPGTGRGHPCPRPHSSCELCKPLKPRVCVLSRSVMSSSFATPSAVAHQASLSMGILQARILEWVAMPSSRGSSQLRDQTQVLLHCRQILYCLSQ